MKLYPFQTEGAAFLARKSRAYLADEMGLGKSAQGIAACDLVGAETILVLCPGIVRANWAREFGRFSRRERQVRPMYTGRDEPIEGGVTVCSYDLLTRKAVLEKLTWLKPDVLLLDEAHFLKNRSAKRTKAVLGGKCDGKTGLVAHAEHAWALSGTPAPNTPDEIWPVLRAFGATDLSYWGYIKQYCKTYDNGFGLKVTGVKNPAGLRNLLAPIMLRRRKKDVLQDLPELTIAEYNVEAGEVDADLWFTGYAVKRAGPTLSQRLSAERAKVEQALAAGEDPLKALAGVAGSVSTLRKYLGLAKVPATIELIRDTLRGNSEQLVVFAHHRIVLEALFQELDEFRPVLIMGGTPAEKRQHKIDVFAKPGNKCRLFLGQIAAAGTGVDGLQNAASRVLIVEPDWVPAQNAQAIMRVHRNGQKRPVLAQFITLQDSLDEHIIRTIRRKVQNLTQIFD